ncbi:outer membrane protein assembly factor BamA [Natronoflexus pectinivorans]|uniref:Outer membrane protein assembly factor BamA n=1 Tax=Natronoflexus pectinivorans TaxID=682526 RepID=A0A4R2GAT7_9BACT|nr:outer membrane protein assembly factor BamA [Natronoflexus pectinivorans]TCO04986.1 outer membrane protein insertion porin family [Natronoflexus pectinivorans]
MHLRAKYTYFIFVFILLFPVVVFGQQESVVRKVKFKGNYSFSNKELMNEISFSHGRWITRKLLGREASYYSDDAWDMNVRELIHFYQSQGFMHIKVHEPNVKLSRNRQRAKVTFVISEGDPVIIESVEFRGENPEINKELNDQAETRRSVLEARKGERFQDNKIWNDRDRITRFLVEKGYAYAETEPEIRADTARNNATVIWQLSPGPVSYFGEVIIEGNQRTPTNIVERQLAFSHGDLYSRQKLNRSQQQVYQLGTFRVASVRARLSRDFHDTIPVHISITEAPQTSTRVGVGYGREDQFRTFVDFQVLNFTGGARRLNLFAKHSALEPYRFEATLTQPAAFSPNSTLALSPSVRRMKEPGFELFTYGANISLLQRISERVSGSFNIYYDNVNLDTTSVALFEDSDFLAKTYSKSGVATGLFYDSSSPRFDPTRGWMIAFNARANSFIFTGDYPFLKYQIEVKNYQPFLEIATLATKIKAGTVHSVGNNTAIPVEERFFSGGSRSVRGWARQQLGPTDSNGIPVGGKYLFEMSVEPRIKIVGPLSIVAFMDAGNVWQTFDDVGAENIRFSAGGGIRFATPIGPVGADLARPVWDTSSSWQFHINIGHAF